MALQSYEFGDLAADVIQALLQHVTNMAAHRIAAIVSGHTWRQTAPAVQPRSRSPPNPVFMPLRILTLCCPQVCSSSDGDTVAAQPQQRVDLASTFVDFEVQVRSRRLATVSHSGDPLTGADALTHADERLVDVAVHSDGAVVVAHSNPQPEPTGGAG